MEVFFLADQTNGVLWHLRYRAFQSDGVTANPSSYKWEAVGPGPAMLALVATLEVSFTVNAWHDLATPGPFIAAPLAGEYDVRFGATGNADTAQITTLMGLDFGTSWTVTNPALTTQTTEDTGGTGATSSFSRQGKMAATAAGNIFKARYKQSAGGNSAQWKDRWLAITPVRVG
jgi:hypothetical protein